MYWQKTGEKTTEQIDTEKDKYKNSSNLRLTVNFESKEDKGEYQVVLAGKHNGGDYKLCSNRIYLTPIGGIVYIYHTKKKTGKKILPHKMSKACVLKLQKNHTSLVGKLQQEKRK